VPVTYTIAPASGAEPLLLADAKLHLREDGTDQDALIGSLITAAREAVEGATGRRLMPATVVEQFDAFPWRWPAMRRSDRHQLRLGVVPVRSVTSVAYVDADGATQTLDPANYRADLTGEPARIEPAYGLPWPVARCVVNAVTVTYAAGYADAASVPVALKQAMLLLVGHWYANREAAVVGTIAHDVPLAAQSLMDRWAVYTR
jgi:uncharacterized phiE125 gp8 family phage protein